MSDSFFMPELDFCSLRSFLKPFGKRVHTNAHGQRHNGEDGRAAHPDRLSHIDRDQYACGQHHAGASLGLLSRPRRRGEANIATSQNRQCHVAEGLPVCQYGGAAQEHLALVLRLFDEINAERNVLGQRHRFDARLHARQVIDLNRGADQWQKLHGIEQDPHERMGQCHGRRRRGLLDDMDIDANHRVEHLRRGHPDAEAAAQRFAQRLLHARPAVVAPFGGGILRCSPRSGSGLSRSGSHGLACISRGLCLGRARGHGLVCGSSGLWVRGHHLARGGQRGGVPGAGPMQLDQLPVLWRVRQRRCIPIHSRRCLRSPAA